MLPVTRAAMADLPPPANSGARGSRYDCPVHFLFVCTANLCRSPMASSLLTARIANHADPVMVSSAGLRAASGPVPPEVLKVMAPYGIDLSGHRSRSLTRETLRGADLVIGMTRRHVQEVILADPSSWPHVFMYRELVRRASVVGPRRADQGFCSWIEAVHGDRPRASLFQRNAADEVADPYGKSLARYRSTALQLAELTSRLTDLLWPALPDPTGQRLAMPN